MNTPPPLTHSDATPTACAKCGSSEFSSRTKLPVCERCRVALVKYPFPLWVRIATSVVVMLVVVSLALSQERIHEAYHFKRAEKMVGQQRWEEAYQSYRNLIAGHTDTETLLTYAETALKSGHYEDAASALTSLNGRYVADYHNFRAEVVSDELERLAGMSAQKPEISSVPAKSGLR